MAQVKLTTEETLPSYRMEEISRNNFFQDFRDLPESQKESVRKMFMYELIMANKPVRIVSTY